ncbi:hypothetical protein ACJ72_01750 [Emergomyces africanus]|uniref:Uncharacterized protein n=1 Tax=Emergomyces africanus TaxID=1955775 RepID=A0A1B7P4D9_9EURO|nr:hypothetical protein ACJ72_01750 [Emergomyces africanus]
MALLCRRCMIRKEIRLTSNRPGFTAFRKCQGLVSKGTYLRPFVNVEDILEFKTLLLFLNARGRNPPCMFAHADFNAIHLVLVSGDVCKKVPNDVKAH